MPDEDRSDPDPDPGHSARMPASRLLRAFASQWTAERVRLGDVADALGDRAYGLLLLIFAFPNIFPHPIPGLSALLGVPLMLVAVQLLIGLPKPWFPKVLGDRSMARADFVRMVEAIIPWIERMERFLRPRILFLSGRSAERMLAALCLVLATVLALPIPLGNILPALAVSLIALGLVERDGAAILAGVVVGAVSLAVVGAVVIAAFKMFIFFLGQAF
ncbi:MAG: exopolysaccharide biosynthesis protein [Rhodospirillaceae bacterium]|nr:exopolysaccharide biosynthesis protein [Rhodospirillaceae bacterium]